MRNRVAICILLLIALCETVDAQRTRARRVRPRPPVPTAACTATSDGTASDTQTKINAVSDGQTVCLPAGSFTWTTGVTVSSKGISILGAGGWTTGTTTITDSMTSGTLITMNPTFGNALSRLAYITFNPTLPTTGYSTPVIVSGTCASGGCPNFRLDHVTVPTNWEQAGLPDAAFIFVANVFGVADHNTAGDGAPSGSYLNFINIGHGAWQGVGGYGDKSYASALTFGTEQTFFLEDNTFVWALATDTDIGDSSGGGARLACRYNNFNPLHAFGGCSGHGTDTTGRARGVRQWEIYNNTGNCQDSTFSCRSLAPGRSGTGILIGNSFTNQGSGFMYGLADLNPQRTWRNSSPWGYCYGNTVWDANESGSAAYSGTIGSVSQPGGWTITDSGSPGWTTDQWAPSGAPYSFWDVTQGFSYAIASNTGSALTTQFNFNNTGVNVPTAGDSYQIWRATACMDQPTRGGGVLLSGTTPTPSGAVNQTREPTYEAADTLPAAATYTISSAWGGLIADRDWYAESVNQAAQTSATSPFNGTSGTGHGTLARIPTTCTTGVGYWATDTNGLYTCTSTNNWRWSWSPFTYPHPLLGQLPVNNYGTVFPRTENPIATPNGESASAWTGGQDAGGNHWGNVQTNGTMVYGVSQPTSYGDPTAILKGTWGATQGAQATVKIGTTPAVDSEVEIRLRSTISANSITGYEAYCNTRPANPYCHIATWGGPEGCWDNFEASTPSIALVDGDTLSATVTGTSPVVIKLYVNGILQATATDNGSHTPEGGAGTCTAGDGYTWGVWTSGNPGIGFYDAADSNWSRFGFSKFSAVGQ